MAITILHIFPDDKFFDLVSTFFDKLESVTNLYYFYSPSHNCDFKFIKSVEKVRVISDRSEYLSLFHDPKIDALYFHSMNHEFYSYFKHIDERKRVFWWCWGFDIYQPNRLVKPFVKIDLFKPLTKRCVRRDSLSFVNLLRFFYRVLRLPYDISLSRLMLKRVDFFTPVLPIEYSLMKEQNMLFRAKPFMIDSGPWFLDDSPLRLHKIAGNVLIGNSLSYTNNHHDIFNVVSKFHLTNRKFIVPISYGSDYGANRELFKKRSGLKEDSVMWLDGFMPYPEYSALLSSVTHAIFGSMRQLAVGNINICFLSGVKVFFYRDSLLYRSYNGLGYKVFTIEDDLSDESLKNPLSEEDALINYNLLTSVNRDKILKAQKELSEIFT